ncbi:DNA-binding protein [Robbsia andropogonis]|uniref:Cytokinin riboside 5'-monophosphate phosphoribohydrolase n=1 Tax=Robbsia andropogonis TaxID=28092 RepID=A0A0F5K129_9BURK|nr:TIGR00730 family Rossman fold protein [Robbsia andropogonis]KKB63564.1 DNA-binding protein [Robbsia andropogonis]MCP1116776.1 TIGR00730 family Rossman fold protein [Robbsia andropogonis]MCP1126545.1 TIGR00730 family Rossman fold protein [Robbsia andropogonis]
MQSVCVYCGSSYGTRSEYKAGAQALGQAMAERDIALIYGGGRVGLMGTIADAILAAGGRAIGVIPQLLVDKEVAHTGLTALHVVPDMHVRKKKMADLAEGFIAMPGGGGTLEELFEVFTWAQLGYHDKPMGLLNIAGFYDPLVTMLQHTADEGFIRPAYLDLLQSYHDPAALLNALHMRGRVKQDKWADGRNAV